VLNMIVNWRGLIYAYCIIYKDNCKTHGGDFLTKSGVRLRALDSLTDGDANDEVSPGAGGAMSAGEMS